MTALKQEIAQQRPFSGPGEEALLNLIRTADCVQRAMQRRTKSFGVTATQYNVLRILRGSHPQGLTCSAIGERMITAEPDITRLLGRLKVLKLIRQQRDKRDKRVLWTQISQAGMTLLAEMDPVVERFPQDLFSHLEEEELSALTDLLERARKHCDDAQAPPTCDGAGHSQGCDRL